MVDVEILMAGAGPAGLFMARALAGSGLRVAVADPQRAAALAAPADDGREIALNQRSLRILRELQAWDRIGDADRAPLRAARVMDRELSAAMRFDPSDDGALGMLVSNHALRRAAWECVQGQDALELLPEQRVVELRREPDAMVATLQHADGTQRSVRARLVIAADTRFSQLRRMMGIGAEQFDFGKSMLVCRMRHDKPHESTAWEWFGLQQTLALLPLAPGQASIVLTLPPLDMQVMQQLDADAFARDIERRFDHRLGAMELISDRFVYPLVGVYAQRFSAPRFALLGDAAVGMHPVTAHGMNFGLLGVELLAAELRGTADVGDAERLARYARRLRLATRPLYLATEAVVRLYTDSRPPALALRGIALRAAQALAPLRAGVTRALLDPGEPLALRLAARLPPLPGLPRLG
jgi:ubiquinone biosynthesis UbiH/UbiF/VisC/COQ6 family hydroxylase